MKNTKIELTKGGKNVDGVFEPNMSITSATLSPQPSFQLTPPKPPTAAKGMLAEFETGTDQFTKNLERQRNEAQKGEEESFGQYLSNKINTPGESQLTASAYGTEGGVDDTQVELDDINNQLLREQHGLTRKLQALEKNPQGLFGGALQDEMSRVERESLRKQADLSIIQQGIQGRFNSAKAIADRAIDAQLEEGRLRNEVLKENYERNKGLFTQAEQRQFETAQADRERSLNREEAELKSVSDLSIDALRNGAPQEIAAQMRQAKTLNEAMQIGGQYVGMLDRMNAQLQLQKLRKEIELLGEPSDAEIKKLEDAKNNEDTARAVANDKIQTIDLLYKENPDGTLYKHPGMKGSVGAYGLARWTPLDIDRADRQTFVATVEQLRSREFVDAILSMKQQGGTLGALNEEEGRQMRNAATKMEQWALKDDDGKVYGYETSEKDFAAELKLLRSLSERALVKAGGSLVSEEEDEELDELLRSSMPQSTVSGASYY